MVARRVLWSLAMRTPHAYRALLALSLSLSPLAAGCGAQDEMIEEEGALEGEKLGPSAGLGKEDGMGRAGPFVNNNTRATQVWTASNAWEDRDTPAARKAGVAWAANSGLNWDEKYAAWVESMPKVKGYEGYDTFQVTTPWGKVLPAPTLECAETAYFLRATFASWYNLPFFVEAVDDQGRRLFVGHFGVRTLNSNAGPNFALRYKDYTSTPPADVTNGWPHDEALRQRELWGGAELQLGLGPDLHFGAYADELFLNKRAGHFMMYLLDSFGSINLVDPANTYNLTPEAIRAGDALAERWQKNGIGHVLPLKHVGRNSEDRLVAELASGSMPRRQPKWTDEVVSKNYFTSEYTGGQGANSDGDEYVKLGGGVKRWRVVKNINGYWTNTIMQADVASWIRSDDWTRLAARPEQFQDVLGEVPPAEKRAALLQQIEAQRTHLASHPASCSAREQREQAFRSLYDLNQRYFGISRAETDRDNRLVTDYIFGELVYAQSKTCCWNGTTPEMYQIVIDYNQALQDQSQQCLTPVVFKAKNGGYDEFRAYAERTGRGAAWRDWSEDEPCAQRGVNEDTEAPRQATAWCLLDANN